LSPNNSETSFGRGAESGSAAQQARTVDSANGSGIDYFEQCAGFRLSLTLMKMLAFMIQPWK
jgi:hypothetical protein